MINIDWEVYGIAKTCNVTYAGFLSRDADENNPIVWTIAMRLVHVMIEVNEAVNIFEPLLFGFKN